MIEFAEGLLGTGQTNFVALFSGLRLGCDVASVPIVGSGISSSHCVLQGITSQPLSF